MDGEGPSFQDLKNEIRKRCEIAKLECSEEEGLEANEPGLRVSIPAGRDVRRLFVMGATAAARLLSIPFEEYRFVGDYDAIAHYRSGAIEARLRSADFTPGLLRRLFPDTPREPDAAKEQDEAEPATRLDVARRNSARGERVILQRGSRAINTLVRDPVRSRGFILRIEGAPLLTHEQALERLESIGNAFLLQLDLTVGSALYLRSHRRYVGSGGLAEQPAPEPVSWRYPEYAFPREPMELYWYARSARGMPLLEFLAYYQVLEYFFPTYSQREARLRVRNVLKDPSFNSERESDLTRLLGTMRPASQSGFGNEREQLKDAIRSCVDPLELRQLLTADNDTKELFSKKHAFLKRTLSLNVPDSDVRDEVAERIYEVRCMIVHTKNEGSDGNVRLLLPFSREALQLVPEISLVRYAARRVLIASGKAIAQ